MIKINSAPARAAVLALAFLGLAGCSNMDDTQQRMVSGGAIGVVAGAAGTVVTGGCVACGMAIGGAVGTAGGYLIDQLDHTTKSGPSSSGYSSNTYSSNNAPQGYPPGGYGNQ